ncbi:hypothetical protein HPB51_020554 [Rhipicephalus microplus]|uniref:Uncharacterized protein n=1 Tax=Rhipicephalus microplus TaxID=6941 RepID=A0A9J6E3I6_RHIMP|nr:hypothetical protein HPB51_020554 [Rhipicephalus microplus]
MLSSACLFKRLLEHPCVRSSVVSVSVCASVHLSTHLILVAAVRLAGSLDLIWPYLNRQMNLLRTTLRNRRFPSPDSVIMVQRAGLRKHIWRPFNGEHREKTIHLYGTGDAYKHSPPVANAGASAGSSRHLPPLSPISPLTGPNGSPRTTSSISSVLGSNESPRRLGRTSPFAGSSRSPPELSPANRSPSRKKVRILF